MSDENKAAGSRPSAPTCSPEWATTIEEAAKKIQEGLGMLSSGPLSYYLKKMVGSSQYLIDRFCPFRVGEKVILAETPTIDEDRAPGWMGARHFLVEGATATVRTVDCDERGFFFGLEFDDESFVYRGETKPVQQKHIYCFAERWISKANA